MNSLTICKQNCIGKQFEALGTINEIQIFNETDEKIVERAVERVLEIDDRMSAFKPDSDISRLNRSAGKNEVTLHPDTLGLLRLAASFSDLSDGVFDTTIRPLVELWGIGKKQDYIPESFEIDSARRLVNFHGLKTDFERSTAYLKKQGQAIDLGSIAKGYAADEVKRILSESDIKSAIINLGGNIVTVGTRPDHMPWKIGIQNPVAPTGAFLGTLSVSDKTVVTSGSNERFFIKDCVRYHHIIDPRTGRPAQSGLLSVTVVCESSVIADILTTVVFILGLKKGADFLKEYNADAIFVTEECQVFLTEGLIYRFVMNQVS